MHDIFCQIEMACEDIKYKLAGPLNQNLENLFVPFQ